MDEAPSLDIELLRELVLEMIRADTLTEEMIENVRRRFEAEANAHAGSDRAERYTQLAHMALVLPLEASATTAVDFRAERRRARLHIVTPDGGNP